MRERHERLALAGRGREPCDRDVAPPRVTAGPLMGQPSIFEAITLTVFVVFAYLYLGEALTWRYALSFVCLFAAVAFAFWGRV